MYRVHFSYMENVLDKEYLNRILVGYLSEWFIIKMTMNGNTDESSLSKYVRVQTKIINYSMYMYSIDDDCYI